MINLKNKRLFLFCFLLIYVFVNSQPGLRIPGKPIVFTNGDTTPSVKRGSYFKTNNSTATTIIKFDSTSTGDPFMVEVNDDNTTVSDTTWIDWPADYSMKFKIGDIFECKEQSGICKCWVVRTD
jgi:hypothetical protein